MKPGFLLDILSAQGTNFQLDRAHAAAAYVPTGLEHRVLFGVHAHRALLAFSTGSTG